MQNTEEIEQFREYLLGRVSLGTAMLYTSTLYSWFMGIDGGSATPQAAQEYVDALTKAGKSPSTVGVRAHALMRYFRWKGQDIHLDCPTIRMGIPDYLNMNQLHKVVASCTTQLESTLVTVLFDTALRINELLSVELGDIDWDLRLISIVGKGGRHEEVNISKKALNELGKWVEMRKSKSERVFMDLTYYDAWRVIQRIGKQAGIRLHPHIFRHSRAIMMLKAGVKPYVVKDHLRHKSIATTMNIYGAFLAMDIKEDIPEW